MIAKVFGWFEGNYIMAVICTVLVFIALFMPGDPEPGEEIPHLDKVIHLLMFAGMCFCWLMVRINENSDSYVIYVLLALIVLTVGSELIQYYWIPRRSGDWFDGLADTVGIATGLLTYRIWLKSKRSKAVKQ